MRIDINRFKPSIIDRYVFLEFLNPFLGGIVFLVFIFLMLQMLRLAEFLIVHGVSLWTLVKLVFFLTLSFLPLVLPVSVLVGTLVGYGRLSSDSELVAMKASGISLLRLSRIVFLFSVVVAFFSFLLSTAFVPRAEYNFRAQLLHIGETKAMGSLREGTFTSGFFNLLVYADKVNSKENKIERVFIYDEREKDAPMVIIAQEGEIQPLEPSSNYSSAALLRLFDGSIHFSDQEKKGYQLAQFKEEIMYLHMDPVAGGFYLKSKMLTNTQIKEELSKLTDKDRRYLEGMAEMWRRTTVSLSAIVFALIGIGFGTVRTRAVRASALLVVLIVVVLYWTLLIWTSAGAVNGVAPAAWLLQVPNLVMLGAAAWGLKRAYW